MDFEQGMLVNGDLFWRTNTGASYIPPSTFITYNFEIEDSAGNTLITTPEILPYHDSRFEWIEISNGPVTVAYHGPVATRAQAILDVIIQTLDKMGPVLGAETLTPIRVAIYNNQAEMLQALPPRSAAVGRELITEGQAFSDIGTLLVLAGGRLALGTASHEVTHILVYRAGDSVIRGVPSWLNEGLAEFGNVDPGFSYDIALEFAIGTDRLIPIVFTQTLPGVPEDVIIYYGQSRSLIRYMIQKFGPEKMQELMAALKNGTTMDSALTEVYGMDRLGLYNLWLKALGADPYELPDVASARPTPIAFATVAPFTLTPQADAVAIGSSSGTATPEPETQQPIIETTPGADQTGSRPQAAPGGCNATSDSLGSVEVSSSAILLGLLGMVFGRFRKRNL
ncbi:MAG: peptidase MA family metallohydrolase [Chloroflexi bacterium]|nr:peptidase MA family metallohydrolase [Chloroflexota bacterium]